MSKEEVIKNLTKTLSKTNLNPIMEKALKKRLEDVKEDKPVKK